MLIVFGLAYIKNPFSSPWTQKLKLEPPSRLTDPKYGVHKYIKVNVSKYYFKKLVFDKECEDGVSQLRHHILCCLNSIVCRHDGR